MDQKSIWTHQESIYDHHPSSSTMTTFSIGPMCILVKDHSRALCEQLQQLRLQTGLVDLDIVCEGHHINVHKVVLAACCKFFREQLCKVNVQVPVILRLEDFGLELTRDAVSYIIEFIYRGEVNIPGEKLTDVCQAAHTLGVIGLEHLPVPARQQRPAKLTKDHIQITDEAELFADSSGDYGQDQNLVDRNDQNNKINMDIIPSSLCVPLLGGNHDDIMILDPDTGEDVSRMNSQHPNNFMFNQNIVNHGQNDPDIIPLSFSEAVSMPQESGPRYTQQTHQNNAGVNDQYMALQNGPFHEETIDSCLSMYTGGGENMPQNLSPSKVTCHMGDQMKNGAQEKMNQGQQNQNDMSMSISGNSSSFQALFDAASNELVSPHTEPNKSSTPTIPPLTVSSSSSPDRPVSTLSMAGKSYSHSTGKSLANIKPATPCATSPARSLSTPPKISQGKLIETPGKCMSQGKLRVINQGMQSENIQSPSLAESRNKARRTSGQIGLLSGSVVLSHLPGQVGHLPSQVPHIGGPVPHIPVTPVATGSGRGASVRLLSVGAQDTSHDSDPGLEDVCQDIADQYSGSDSEVESEDAVAVSTVLPPSSTGLATPSLWPGADELWAGPRSQAWTHPVESVDTTIPTSGSVWQLPTAPPPRSVAQPPTNQWGALGLGPIVQESVPAIPWNTPVPNDSTSRDAKWENPSVGTVVTATGSRDTPPTIVSWTQPQSSASPSPMAGGVISGALPPPQEVELTTSSSTSPSLPEGGDIIPASNPPVWTNPTSSARPSWNRITGVLPTPFPGDDNMLAIRSGIPLALQNKAIRSGEPIGPFQNKRKRKSRASQDSGKSKKRSSISGKKGDLEVRKDLTIESQKTVDSPELMIDNVFSVTEPTPAHKVEAPQDEDGVGFDDVSHKGSVHVKTVKKLNSDADAASHEMDSGQMSMGEVETVVAKVGQPFSCVSCSMRFSSPNQLRRHTTHAHGNDETLFCQVCPERCKGKENLKLHLYKTHGIGEMFRCEECNFESPIKAGFIKHISEHIPPEAHKKKCPKCEKVFKTKAGLNMHLKHHFDESLFTCLSCDFKTPQRFNLVKHMAAKHGQDVDGNILEATLFCSQCDFKCIAEHMLKNHMLRKHTTKSAMRFRCSICSYASVERAALDKHVRFKHTNERPFMCDTCGFSTHTASAMARHKRSHSNSKPHKCEICGHEYADKKRLRDHMYIHSDNKPFRCEICSYTCRRRDNLTSHLKKHHDVKKCEVKTVIADSTSNEGGEVWASLGPELTSFQDTGQVEDLLKPSLPRATSSPIAEASIPSTSQISTSHLNHSGEMSAMSTIAMADIAVPPNPSYIDVNTMSYFTVGGDRRGDEVILVQQDGLMVEENVLEEQHKY